MCPIKIRFIIFIVFTLTLLSGQAQGSLDEIFISGCVEIKSDTTITSEFHQSSLKIPDGWVGILEDDNPVPAWKIKNSTNHISVTISQSFDASEIFEWAKANLDLSEYEIVEMKNSKILVENGKNGKPYWLTISDKMESGGTWVWRVRLGLHDDMNEEVKCGLSFIINQMIN